MTQLPPHIVGLTPSEVDERKNAALINTLPETNLKPIPLIIKNHVFTLFNFLNLTIALFLAAVGAYRNLFFMLIILMNISIGIYQEISARNLVGKLSLLSREKVSVIRDGKFEEIDSQELVKDDIIILNSGQQVPADAIVIDGRAGVNESLLTGEPDVIQKAKGHELLSGSFVSSGVCYAKITHVGEENYAAKITQEARIHTRAHSELLAAIRKVARFTSIVIIPLGVALFFQSAYRSDTFEVSVVSTAAALLGMLPKGLALLISIALATAVVRLGKKNILVQSMFAIETLAHIDTLCLDKTGTLTEGKMQLLETILLEGITAEQFKKIMGSYLEHSDDNNITMLSLRKKYPAKNYYSASSIIPFSSEKKWGMMYLDGIGTVALGAPERLLGETPSLPLAVKKAQEKGLRTLMAAFTPDRAKDENKLPENLLPIAVFVIDDPIRKDAKKTLEYLYEEGIDIKIISGDDPVTVANIGLQAGVRESNRLIDLSHLDNDEDVAHAALNYTVFGRVSPQQKKILVKALKQNGRKVGMTGDGVNDILALQEADISIAMAEGDPATRQISKIVLLDSDFTALPDVLYEGRRVVNNLTKVAGVFFIKTIYSFVLSLVCLAGNFPFPFIPIQITLIDLAIEGYPAFFLSFESDKRKISKGFLSGSLKRAFPFAVLVILNILAIQTIGAWMRFSKIQATTLMFYMLMATSIFAVIKACLPLNPLRAFLIITTSIGSFLAAILFHPLLGLAYLQGRALITFGILVIITLIITVSISRFQQVYAEESSD